MSKQYSLFSISKTASERKDRIISTLYFQGAKNLSDSEIEKSLAGTCLPTKLISIAKELRDFGLITINDLKE